MSTLIYMRSRPLPPPLACRRCSQIVYTSSSREGWIVLPHDCTPQELETYTAPRPAFSPRLWWWGGLYAGALAALVWWGLRW